MKPLNLEAQPAALPTRRIILKYKGVRKRSWGRWVAEIRVPHSRHRLWLGSYACPHQAARAYDVAAICLRGPSATQNLPFHAPPSPSTTAASLSPTSIRSLAAREAARFHHDQELQPNVGSDCSSAAETRSLISPLPWQGYSSSHSVPHQQDSAEISFNLSHPAALQLQHAAIMDYQEVLSTGGALLPNSSHHAEFSGIGAVNYHHQHHQHRNSVTDHENSLLPIAQTQQLRIPSRCRNSFLEVALPRPSSLNLELYRSPLRHEDTLMIDEPRSNDAVEGGDSAPSSLLDCWFSLDLSPTLSADLRMLVTRSLDKAPVS